jgi:rhodanese-related sulfurtransferase
MKLMRHILLYTLLWFSSCNSSAQTYKTVSADAFETGINTNPAISQVLDVRTAGEYKTGHLKKSLQADWNNTAEFQQRVLALDKQKPVYVYCLSGVRSDEAAQWLINNGFSLVVSLKGGLLQWKRAGKPLEQVESVPQMTLAQYQQQMMDKEYVLVDFGADWCPPCRKMEPDINQFLSTHPNITLVKIDAGIHTNLMKQLNVSGIPTLLLVKKGTEVWRNTGIVTAQELEHIWQSKK